MTYFEPNPAKTKTAWPKLRINVMVLLLIFGLTLGAKIEKFSKTPIKKYQEIFSKKISSYKKLININNGYNNSPKMAYI